MSRRATKATKNSDKCFEILTTLEISEILKINKKKARIMLLSGEIPAFKIGGDWRVEAADLRAFIAQRKAELRQQVAD